MEMVFKFREGSHLPGDPQKVGETLTSIESEHGSLTPPIVVKEAEPDDSPLHRYFEWDDAKAADSFRLEQARYLVASVVVVRAERPDATPVRAFVSVKDEGERTYSPIQVVLSQPDLKAQAISDILINIASLRRKLESFEEFADLLAYIEAIENKVAATQEKVIITAATHEPKIADSV